MLKRLRDLANWTVVGREEQDVGTIENSYFDDERWIVRYVVVDAGGWLVDHPVLISPMAIDRVNWQESRLHVDLTRDDVRDAPHAGQGTGLDRQFETRYAGHFGYPPYWTGPLAWGVAPLPGRLVGAAPGSEPVPATDGAEGRGQLHSVEEVTGYHLQALDGEIGHVEDFIIDDESWSVRYLVVDTSNWIGGRTVLVAPEWVRRIDWNDRLFFVDLTRESIKESPAYDPTAELTRDYEDRLHGYYGRAAYWR